MLGRVDNSGDDRVDEDLENILRVFHHALLAKDQSKLQPGGPIGKHWSLVEAETASYSGTCDSTHRNI